jgi:hypothetical protein
VSTPLHIKIFTWLGITALIVQLGVVPLDFLLFRLNQNEIARTLCEHKMPHCNGNCYLMKQLAKSANAANDKRAERFTLQLSGHYLQSESDNVMVFVSGSHAGSHFVNDAVLAGWPSRLFLPPRVA